MLKLRRLYWLMTALVLAVAVHAAYVLIAPTYALQRSIAGLTAEPGLNRFFVIAPASQARLFPAYPPSSVFGACAFDVSKSAVELAAEMPEGMWTLTIYSAAGDALYSLNDRQSGTSRFTVSLSLAPNLLKVLSQAGSEDAVNSTGWGVQTPDPTGLAVVWIPAQEEAMRAGLVETLSRSTCRPAG